MHETEYRRLVIKARIAANAWYREHKQSDLIEAKRLEAEIDKENRRWLQEKAETPAAGSQLDTSG
jgi:hypothetical protein